MNQYEVAILYDPDLEIDLEKSLGTVRDIITGNDGKIVTEENWGKKKLAYPIAEQDQAVYVFYTVELPAQSVRKVESTLNITDEVIRYLISRPDLKAIAKAEEERVTKAEKARARGDRGDDSKDEKSKSDEK